MTRVSHLKKRYIVSEFFIFRHILKGVLISLAASHIATHSCLSFQSSSAIAPSIMIPLIPSIHFLLRHHRLIIKFWPIQESFQLFYSCMSLVSIMLFWTTFSRSLMQPKIFSHLFPKWNALKGYYKMIKFPHVNIKMIIQLLWLPYIYSLKTLNFIIFLKVGGLSPIFNTFDELGSVFSVNLLFSNAKWEDLDHF